jgi:N-acetylglucosaminyldiphosphoundecaprenol N-acetyl-beta-D-mannosaminyltransferase
MRRMDVFGIKIDNLTMEEVLEKIGQFLKSNKQHYVVLPYSEFVVRVQKDEEFRKILNEADFCLCESRGLQIVTRFLKQPIKEPINGVDLIYNLKGKLFLLGGKKDTLKKVKEKLNTEVVGFEDGYQDLDRVIKKINQAKPDTLLVGLGSPKQEKWIYENIKKMPSVKVAIGVGGAFDFISGRIKRAPKFIQRIGLEWFWRLILQPWRIKRISLGVIGLSWLTLKKKIKRVS